MKVGDTLILLGGLTATITHVSDDGHDIEVIDANGIPRIVCGCDLEGDPA